MDAAGPARLHRRMTVDLDRWLTGWRGPALAALVALLAGLPTLLALGPLDRDEARFAQATAQMLETGDLVNIQFQDDPRHKKPVGVHWLQALSVSLVSEVEARDIRPYRIPSLLGAMLAAAAAAWGAGHAMGRRAGFLAGAMLGASFLLSTEAGIAKTDALLAGAVTLSMAALYRLYAEARDGAPAGRRTRVLFWAGVALAVMVKGPIGPLVIGLTLLALGLWDRQWRWMRNLGWVWGLAFLAAVAGPWAAAITVATDGAFWGAAIGGDLAPKVISGHEQHGGWPGYYLLLAPVLLFPATLLLPAGLSAGWSRRGETLVRFALCWLVPTWLAFELFPTKLAHYTLPTFGALAWLMAAALTQPVGALSRRLGVALSAFAAVVVALLVFYGLSEFADPSDQLWATFTVGLAGVGVVVAAFFLLQRAAMTALIVSLAFGVLAHASLVRLVGGLEPLWLSPRLAEALLQQRLHPIAGETPGPVALAGYSEPSAVFLLGTRTQLTDADGAADALAEGRPAVVEAAFEDAFQAAAARRGLTPAAAGEVVGMNYSKGDPARLTLYRPERRARTGPAPESRR